MTINQLRRYRKIKANILLLESELDELILKSKPYDLSGGNPPAVSDNVARIVVEREEARKRIDSLLAEKLAIEGYISRCEPYYSVLLRWHYMEGRTWTAIAIKIGGGNTEDGVRKACHRYVVKNP